MMKFSPVYLLLAILLFLTGCASSSRRSTSSAGSGESRQVMERAINSSEIDDDRRRLLEEARQWLGIPYRYGGSTPAGVDCSGFVHNVYRTAMQMQLPRSSREQARVGSSVDIDDAEPGDLVFFNTSGGGVSHVGIIVEGTRFIHASTSAGVIVSSLEEKYYRERFMFARQVIE